MIVSKPFLLLSHFFGATFIASARLCVLALISLMISATGASAQNVTINSQGSGGANVRTFDAGGSLTLTAASISGLASPFTYIWQPPNAAGTPAGVTFSRRDQSTFTITASPSVLDGTTFGVRLQVFGTTSAGPAVNSASITIRNHNMPPTADAGDNQRVDKGATVTLDGTGSNDPDGDNSNLRYFWTQTAGPDVTLSSPTAAQPTFIIPDVIPPAPGPASVTFSLRVRDAAYPATDEDTDDVRIFVRPLFRTTIANQTYSAGNAITDLTLPEALAGPAAVPSTNAYTLSSVPNGLSLNNRILSGTPTGTMRTRTFNLTYTATNGDGDTDSLPFNITVTNAPATGVPTISGDPIEDEKLTAAPSGIDDANGFEVISEGVPPEFTYQWQADGAAISGATSSTYSLTTAEIGKAITVTASFIDGGGRQESRTSAATAAVRAANEPPMASAGSNQTVNEGATVTLDGTGTTDPDAGDILTYSWAQTSGTTVTLNDTSAISPTFTAPVRQTMTDGELAFTLTVTDSENETSTATVTISVTNLPPIAVATVVGGTAVNEGEEVTLDGSGSSGLPGDGRTYLWTQTSGTDVTLNDATAISPTFTAPVRQTADDEELVFSLTVRDAAGGSNTVTVTISVTNLPPEANAGEPQTVDEGEEVTLDGSGSSGLPGDGRTYAWTQTGGTTVSLTVSDTDPTIATFTAPTRQSADDGEFEFTLTVRDAAGAENTDTVAISVSTDASVQKTVETINRFMETRTRLILANQPDASRRIDRLRSGVGPEQLSFATGEINKLMPVDFNLRDLVSGTYKFATSLDQVTRAAAHLEVMQGGQVAQGGTAAHERRRLDVWVEGGFHRFNGGAGSDGDFAIVHLGADYLVSPGLLVGAVVQYDSLTDSNDGDNSRIDGKGWLAGPYVTARLQENLYLDARVAGGASDNDVTPTGAYTDNFKSTRWLADVSLSGVFTHDQWTLRPNAALSWLADKQKSYTGTLGDTIPGQTVSQGQFRFGPTVSRWFLGDNGWRYEPTLTLDAIYSHADTSGGGGFLTTTAGDGDGWRARVAPGISMTDPEGARRLSLTGNYDGIGQSDYEAWGLGVKLNMKF